ncbi:MAG: hypothetical protein VW378_04950 [bacterium]
MQSFFSGFSHKASTHTSGLKRMMPLLSFLPRGIGHPKQGSFYQIYLQQGLRNHYYISEKRQWSWPFWAQHQLDPQHPLYSCSESPFMLQNHSCRNWGTLSLPGQSPAILYDPKGMLTFLPLRWSLEFWIVYDQRLIFPSDWDQVQQTHSQLGVLEQRYVHPHFQLTSHVLLSKKDKSEDFASITLSFQNLRDTDLQASLIMAIRPYNSLGISGIQNIQYLNMNAFMVDDQLGICLNSIPDNILCLSAQDGDVSEYITQWEMILRSHCKHYLASAAAEYRFSLQAQEVAAVSSCVPFFPYQHRPSSWTSKLTHIQQLSLKKNIQFLNSVSHEKINNSLKKETKTLLSPITNVSLADSLSTQLLKRTLTSLLSFLGPGHTLSGMLTPQASLVKVPLALYVSLFQFRGNSWVMPAVTSLLRSSWHNDSKQLTLDPTHNCRIFCFLQHCCYHFDLENILDSLQQKGLILAKLILNRRLRHDSTHTHWVGLLKQSYSCDQSFELRHYLWDNLWAWSVFQQLKTNSAYKQTSSDWLDLQIQQFQTGIMHLCQRYSDLNKTPLSFFVSNQYFQETRLLDVVYTAVFQDLFNIQDPIVTHTLSFLETLLNSDYLLYTPLRYGYDMGRQFKLLRLFIRQRNPKAFVLYKRLISFSSCQDSWPEVLNPQTLGGAFGQGHCPFASALFAQCVYDFLIYETVNNIYLLPFLPPDWMPRPDAPLSIERLYTRFGSIDLHLSYISENKVRLSITPHFKQQPNQLFVSFPYTILKLEDELGHKEVHKKQVSISKTTTQITFYLDAPIRHTVS